MSFLLAYPLKKCCYSLCMIISVLRGSFLSQASDSSNEWHPPLLVVLAHEHCMWTLLLFTLHNARLNLIRHIRVTRYTRVSFHNDLLLYRVHHLPALLVIPLFFSYIVFFPCLRFRVNLHTVQFHSSNTVTHI